MDPELCRACLQNVLNLGLVKNKSKNKNENNPPLSEMFYDVTGYKIDEENSQIFCNRCLEELIISFNFKQRCKESQIKLLIFSIEVDVKQEEDSIDNSVHSTYDKCSSDNELDTSVIENLKNAKLSYLKQCYFCDENFKSEKALVFHMNTDHPKDKTKKCSSCGESLFPQLYEKHIQKCKKHLKEQRVVCSFCGAMISQRHLLRHIKTLHEINESFTCDLCGTKVKTKTLMVSHMKNKHLPGSWWQCRICLDTFKSNAGLSRHRRKEHPDEYSVLKCKYCDYTSLSHSNLRCHTLAHIGDAGKNHQCPHCNMKFYQKHQLHAHVSTHTNEVSTKLPL